MILKSLYDYAHAHADSVPTGGMEFKEIEFVIVIDADGNFMRFESRRIDKKRCATFLVPKAVKRTSAPKSNILWDNGKYVLGLGEKADKCYPLFLDIVRDIVRRHPEDKSIQALSKFYDKLESSGIGMMESDPAYPLVKESPANFSFRLDEEDILIAEKKYLFEHIIKEIPADTATGRCLVTGNHGPIVKTTTATPIPDNSPMAALVSFQVNSGYDSYGKSQAHNSPISIDAEESYSAVLKTFLGKDSRNKLRLADRMFLFWGSGDNEMSHEAEEGLLSLFEIPDRKDSNLNDKVYKAEKLFKSIFSGEIKTTLTDRFHILGLAPNTGRIAVVMWMDSELRDFACHLIRHFDDMDIVDNRNPDKRRPYKGVYSMISAATQGGKLSDALPRLVEATVNAVISGTPYPFPLFSQTIQRIRAELTDIGVTVQRAAILKAYINRNNNNSNNQPILPMLDKSNTNAGYLCGRLTAVLEKIQDEAKSGDSIRTRFMGAASATPATVLPAMLNLSLHHSEKLSEGSRIFYERLKQEIVDKIPDTGFPAHLDLNDQGRFFVGYYHQRTDMYTKKEN